MRRIIVDYKKVTPEILKLLTEKFPDGYDDDDIITFDDHHNQTIDAVEVKTDEAIYLVKVNCRLHYSIANFDNLEIETDDLGNVILNNDLKDDVYKEEDEEE